MARLVFLLAAACVHPRPEFIPDVDDTHVIDDYRLAVQAVATERAKEVDAPFVCIGYWRLPEERPRPGVQPYGIYELPPGMFGVPGSRFRSWSQCTEKYRDRQTDAAACRLSVSITFTEQESGSAVSAL